MDSEDGQIFIQKLAQFIHTHERALANALQAERRSSKTSQNVSKSAALASALARPFAAFSSKIKPAKLTLTPHHLYYLLLKFEELGVNVGNMSVRLENLRAESGPGNYVSFLGQAPPKRRAGRNADTDSLRSVSSMRSVMSSFSTMFSGLGSKQDDARRKGMQHSEDVRYLYSCFTKIPALCVSPDPTTHLIAGYEEFPFDTAVPLWVFRNLSSLEVSNLDFRQMFGWDALSKQLRSLTIRRAGVEDPLDVLYDIVLDDTDRRRRRSARAPVPTTPSTPGLPWSGASPKGRSIEFLRSTSTPTSPDASNRQSSIESTMVGTPADEDLKTRMARQRTPSPRRPFTARPGSGLSSYGSKSALHIRTSSSSSVLSGLDSIPQRSNSDFTGFGLLPPGSWQFLRHLSLADNGLHSISPASFVPVAHTLQSLDLSGNLFSEVPDALATLTHLRALNLSNCMIDSLRSLVRHPLPAITTLNLKSNRLHSLAGIDKLFSIEKIDLRDNHLQDPAELARLTGMPNLSHVWVSRNPFVKSHSEYRINIFNLFRSVPGRTEDVLIDQAGPSHSERKKLIDWVPEAAQTAVTKPVLAENRAPEVSLETPSGKLVTINGADRDECSKHDTAPETAATSAQKNKTARRRVIQLGDGAHHENDTATSVKQSIIKESEDACKTPADEVDVDVYRQEIQILKSDLGAQWLNALARNGSPEIQKLSKLSDAEVRPHPAVRSISVSERHLG